MRRLTAFASAASAATLMTALAWPLLSPSPAAAAKSICVGLVVDAHTIKGPVAVDCATVPSGSTGYDVLRAAGHSVAFRRDGLICAIDHRPTNGCAAIDDSHYWAYFHRTAGSATWTYSNEGASTYQPANGATEGWVWQNGSSTKPPDIPAGRICPPSQATSSARAATTSATAAARTRRTSPSSPGRTAGVLVGVAAVVALGTGAAVQWRRRGSE